MLPPRPGLLRELASYLGVFLLLTIILTFSLSQFHFHWNWEGVWKFRAKFYQGWFVTLGLASGSLVLSALIGILTALGQRSHVGLLRALCKVYVALIRSTPLLVQILIFFYLVAEAFHLQNRWVAGVLILALFSGAYVSEIIRAGLEAIPQTQWESARAIGLTPWQIHYHVVFPQALRQSLPALAGEFVSLIKNSSLLSVIGISEFTLNAQEVNSYTFSTLESYLPLACGYLILTLPLAGVSGWLERRLRYES